MNLNDYLDFVGNTFPYSLERVVRHHGQSFIPPTSPLPKEISRGKVGLCFMNAYYACVYHDGLVYVEGFAVSVIPTRHAWCLDRDGNVIEVTWNPPGLEYFGVVFDLHFVEEVMLEKKTFGVMDYHSMKFKKISIKPSGGLNNVKQRQAHS